MEKFNFGENLRRLREQKNLSQERLAELINYSQSSVYRLEKQADCLDTVLIKKIAIGLDVLPSVVHPNYTDAQAEIKPLAEKKDIKQKGKRNSWMQITIEFFIGTAVLIILVNTFYEFIEGLGKARNHTGKELFNFRFYPTLAVFCILYTILFFVIFRRKK